MLSRSCSNISIAKFAASDLRMLLRPEDNFIRTKCSEAGHLEPFCWLQTDCSFDVSVYDAF